MFAVSCMLWCEYAKHSAFLSSQTDLPTHQSSISHTYILIKTRTNLTNSHTCSYGESLRELADVEEDIVNFSNNAMMAAFRTPEDGGRGGSDREDDSGSDGSAEDADGGQRLRGKGGQESAQERGDKANTNNMSKSPTRTNPALERTIRRAITDFDVKANYRYWTAVSQDDWKTLYVKTQKAGEAVSMTSDFSLDLQKFEMDIESPQVRE